MNAPEAKLAKIKLIDEKVDDTHRVVLGDIDRGRMLTNTAIISRVLAFAALAMKPGFRGRPPGLPDSPFAASNMLDVRAACVAKNQI
jgi:hypothetical protein